MKNERYCKFVKQSLYFKLFQKLCLYNLFIIYKILLWQKRTTPQAGRRQKPLLLSKEAKQFH